MNEAKNRASRQEKPSTEKAATPAGQAAKAAPSGRATAPAETRGETAIESAERESWADFIGGLFDGAVFGTTMLDGLAAVMGAVPEEAGFDAADYAHAMLKKMAPRDPLEHMLVTQALWTHVRLGTLSAKASQATHSDVVKTLNEACDKTTNTFRRLMLALAEYRRPPRGRDAFFAIGQANLAQQQVIQQQNSENRQLENVTNEK